MSSRRDLLFALVHRGPYDAQAVFVYILSSRSRTIYNGMTGDLITRIHEHKTKSRAGFTARYNIDRLVFFQEYPTALEAIQREKELKDWRRELKVALIDETNPAWDDLSDGWFERRGEEKQIPTG